MTGKCFIFYNVSDSVCAVVNITAVDIALVSFISIKLIFKDPHVEFHVLKLTPNEFGNITLGSQVGKFFKTFYSTHGKTIGKNARSEQHSLNKVNKVKTDIRSVTL